MANAPWNCVPACIAVVRADATAGVCAAVVVSVLQVPSDLQPCLLVTHCDIGACACHVVGSCA
jgi:hypothetical protein